MRPVYRTQTELYVGGSEPILEVSPYSDPKVHGDIVNDPINKDKKGILNMAFEVTNPKEEFEVTTGQVCSV